MEQAESESQATLSSTTKAKLSTSMGMQYSVELLDETERGIEDMDNGQTTYAKEALATAEKKRELTTPENFA